MRERGLRTGPPPLWLMSSAQGKALAEPLLRVCVALAEPLRLS